MNKSMRRKKIDHFYLHCFPEICTDAPRTSKHYVFYSQFKSCLNISSSCHKETERAVASEASTSLVITTTKKHATVEAGAEAPRAYSSSWHVQSFNENELSEFEEYQEETDDESGPEQEEEELKKHRKRWASEHVGLHRGTGTDGGINSHHSVDLVDNLDRKSYLPFIMSQCNNKYSLGPVYLTEVRAAVDEKVDNRGGQLTDGSKKVTSDATRISFSGKK
jgi:hypothetical protein